VLAKRSLIRIVRSENGVQIDPSGKLPGRGAYIHDQQSCWERGLKGSLEQALKVKLTTEDRDILAEFGRSLNKKEAPDLTSNEPV